MNRLTVFTKPEESLLEKIRPLATFVLEDLSYNGYFYMNFDGLEPSIAPMFVKLRDILYRHSVDFIIQYPYIKPKLFCFDMDSTLINIESMDCFAERYLGKYIREEMEELMWVPEAVESFQQRLVFLKGLTTLQAMEFFEMNVKNIAYNSGIANAMKALRNRNVKTAILSGGMDIIANLVGKDLGFDHVKASVVDIENDVILGTSNSDDVVTLHSKKRHLLEYQSFYKLTKDQTASIGDGTNDVLMLKESGLGIAYKACDIVTSQINNQINFNDLGVLEFLL